MADKLNNEFLSDIATDWYSQGSQNRAPNFVDVLRMQQERSRVAGFNDPKIQRIARGLLEAEHRGTNPEFNKSDMYIRTKHRKAPGGSSAYGPGQITMNTAKDILQRGNLSPEARKYIAERFIPAGELMLRHGNEGPGRGNKPDFDPTYDYGGQAGLNVQTEYPLYNELWAATIDRKLKDAGVTADQVLDGSGRDAFLSKYYKKGNRGGYDPAFARGIVPEKKPSAFITAALLNKMSPKPKYGLRRDGTHKGHGWVGPIKDNQGRVMTEFTIGIDVKEIPAIVPGLTGDELNQLKSGGMPQSVVDKAVAHARKQKESGRRVFR